MSTLPRQILLPGEAGDIELLVGVPAGRVEAVAVIAHPQPMLGGSARHKLVDFLATALQRQGVACVRPNFRGVGRSQGSYDQGIGETRDLLEVMAWAGGQYALPMLAIGYSFGAFVTARAVAHWTGSGGALAGVALLGCPYGPVMDGRHYETPPAPAQALVVHGEHDERVPLASVFEWCRPTATPVIVLPGADHAFTGRLAQVRSLVVRYAAAAQKLSGHSSTGHS